ncbi:MAG TPA: CPXCG motif-containing cysteine-rich protein [Gemmatimonadaceae bacterium]|jgi:hypothetical protein|nr:CPXCG motif-containing cysteine-rich protein [Gemmatimonadaceae bacterium]
MGTVWDDGDEDDLLDAHDGDDTEDPEDAADTDSDLERDFPLGDGTADTTGVVICPYCGEPNDVAIDPGGGAAQEYVEDCQVCCQPWRVSLHYTEDGQAEITVEPLDD